MTNLNPSAPETHIVQGGGFDGNGNYQEPTYSAIDLEIHADLTHVDGAIAMARTNDPNSATSQFYLCDGPQHDLDDEYRQTNFGSRGYAVFGYAVDEESRNVIKAICSLDTTIDKQVPAPYYTLSNWPLNNEANVVINSITMQ
jgi:cyclophilin family peptidyl-prolyl cis-trans isomerase